MCDLTGSGDCQVAESFLLLSGRLGSRPLPVRSCVDNCWWERRTKGRHRCPSRTTSIFPVDLAKTMTSWKFVGPRSEPDWHVAGSLTSSLRLAISVARRFKWRRLRTGRSVHIAGTHPGRIDEWIDQRAARFLLTIGNVAN